MIDRWYKIRLDPKQFVVLREAWSHIEYICVRGVDDKKHARAEFWRMPALADACLLNMPVAPAPQGLISWPIGYGPPLVIGESGLEIRSTGDGPVDIDMKLLVP